MKFALLNDSTKGILCMLAFAALGTTSYLFVDAAFRFHEDLTVQNAMFWGFVGTFIFVLPLFAVPRIQTGIKSQWHLNKKLITAITALTSFGAFLWFWAMSISSSGPITLLWDSGETVWAAFLGVWLLNERMSVKEVLSMIIVLVGMGFIGSLKGEITWLAVILILFSTLCYAIQSLLVRKYAKDMDTVPFTLIRGCLMTLFLGGPVLLMGEVQMVSWTAFLLLALSQILGAMTSRFFYFQAHKYMEVSKLNMFLLFGPILTLIGARVFLGDVLSTQKLIGATLILGGLFAFTHEQILAQRRK